MKRISILGRKQYISDETVDNWEYAKKAFEFKELAEDTTPLLFTEEYYFMKWIVRIAYDQRSIDCMHNTESFIAIINGLIDKYPLKLKNTIYTNVKVVKGVIKPRRKWTKLHLLKSSSYDFKFIIPKNSTQLLIRKVTEKKQPKSVQLNFSTKLKSYYISTEFKFNRRRINLDLMDSDLISMIGKKIKVDLEDEGDKNDIVVKVLTKK